MHSVIVHNTSYWARLAVQQGAKGLRSEKGMRIKGKERGYLKGGRGERGNWLKLARQVAQQAMELPLQGCL